MSRNYDCPSCGGTVAFQSSIAISAVCPYCQSLIVRRDVDVEAIGKVAQLPPDLSPLQIGTTGEFENQGFTLVGRLRLAYEEGSWNEWFALFSDGRYGWVAEAQGIFMVSFAVTPPAGFPRYRDGLKLGQFIHLENRPFKVTDQKEVNCVGTEGELPFIATEGRKAWSVDCTGVNQWFANVEYAEDGMRLFAGRYMQFKQLNFNNLRPVPGWSDDPTLRERNKTTSVQCPQCAGTVTIRAAGFTMSAACSSCGSLIDTATPSVELIRKAKLGQKIEPEIPLGRRGMLFGTIYEVIGFQQVRDAYSGWSEYLLFNPWEGFAWLVTYNGHWSFIRRLFENPEVNRSILGSNEYVNFRGRHHRLFAQGDVSTMYVLGEFYWKVAIGNPTKVSDYVDPPYILSCESYARLGEETWSEGEYIQREVLEQTFAVAGPLRESFGVYLNEPNPYKAKLRQIRWYAPILAALLVFIQIISCQHAAKKQVFAADYEYRAGMTNPVVITEPFDIGGNQKQAVEFGMNAPVNNNWIELDVDLVDANTQNVVASFEQGIEYYSGYDDGPWSEGSNHESRMVPSVPPGRYYLVIDAFADTAIPQMPFRITVIRDVAVWSNFLVALILVLFYPIYLALRAHAFERARWMESDYSPYSSFTTESDDDDD